MAPKKPPKRIPQTPALDITTADLAAKKATRKKASAARAPTWPEDITWHPQPHYLGGGGCGTALLWLAVDEQERILRRVVVKDCFLECGSWRDVNQWYGDYKDVQGRVHAEVHLHRTIHPPNPGDEDGDEEEEGGRENIARVFHAETYPQEMGYRLYLQYYPHGDLRDILTQYPKLPPPPPAKKKKATPKPKSKSKTKTPRRSSPDPDHEPDVPMIPEPFLWSVLENLTRACLVLENGHTNPNQASPAAEKTWQSIIHRDIKLENIYLDFPHRANFPSYPRAILADLGLAIATSASDPRNPLDFLGWDGTESWQAPEMLPMLHRKTARLSPVGKLGACTNVWGLGGIIIALMNREEGLEGVGAGERGIL